MKMKVQHQGGAMKIWRNSSEESSIQLGRTEASDISDYNNIFYCIGDFMLVITKLLREGVRNLCR